jgi:predicted porin
VPFGASTILASYVRRNDRLAVNRDANQIGVGYTYDMSKRTTFYTAYARIRNKNGGSYLVGNATEAGSGDKAFNLGIRHRF